MIPESTVTAFVVSAIFTLILPVVLLIVLGIKKRISGLPLLIGAVAFFLSQIVLRIPLISVFSTQAWYQDFSMHSLLFIFILSLSAGLFEESARLGGALLLKKHRRFVDALSFGLGHAFCEMIILIGLTQINNIVFCLAINNTNGTFATAIPPETLETVKSLLLDVPPAHVYLGILERFSAVLFHIFLTVLIFQCVMSKKGRYYIYAITAHMLFNAIGALTARYAGIVASETVMLVFALSAWWYVFGRKRVFTEYAL